MKLSPTVIGLGGRLRAGKDVVADHLVEKHGFVKIGMSDALHEAMLAIDPIIDEHVVVCDEGALVHRIHYGEAIAEHGYVGAKAQYPEVRRLLQVLGTEVGRNMIGPNVWTNITARKVDDYLYVDQPVVVTGIRFANEIQMIRQFAGRAFWVDRPSLGESTSTHASENSVSATDFDRTIVNDADIATLRKKVDALLARSI